MDGLAYRRCLAGVPAEWGSVDATECESVAGRAVREKVEQSKAIHYSTQHTETIHNVVLNNNGRLVRGADFPSSCEVSNLYMLQARLRTL